MKTQSTPPSSPDALKHFRNDRLRLAAHRATEIRLTLCNVAPLFVFYLLAAYIDTATAAAIACLARALYR